MHDAELVDGGEGREHIGDPADHGEARDGVVRHARRELLSLEPLHRDVEQLALRVAARVVDLDDVGMPEPRGDAHLAQEAARRLAVVGVLGPEDLERELALRHLVRDEVDRAHTARAEPTLDAVLAVHDRAGLELASAPHGPILQGRPPARNGRPDRAARPRSGRATHQKMA